MRRELPPERHAAGAGCVSQGQDRSQRRLAGRWERRRDPGRAKDSRAHGLLDSHAQESPPAALPPGRGRWAECGWDTVAAEADEEPEELVAICRPPSAGFSPKDQEALGAPARELRVATKLALPGGSQGCPVCVSRAVGRGACRAQGGDEGRVATERFPQGRGSMHDEVEAPAVGGKDPGGIRPCQPLLGNDASLRPCLPCDSDPRVLENVASTSKGSCAGARCGMVPKHIQGLPAPVGARVLPAAGGCERERKAQATPQGQMHVLWAERGAGVGRDGRQPRRGLRPDWERSRAWRSGGWGSTSRSLKLVWRARAAACCHPCGQMPGSASARVRKEETGPAGPNVSQGGRVRQPLSSSEMPAAAASRRQAASLAGPRRSSATQRAAASGRR